MEGSMFIKPSFNEGIDIKKLDSVLYNISDQSSIEFKSVQQEKKSNFFRDNVYNILEGYNIMGSLNIIQKVLSANDLSMQKIEGS